MENTVYAKTKYNRRSARKVRLVVDMIRGKKAQKALEMLKFTNKGATEEVSKTLQSAIANATFNNNMDKNELVVAEAFVDEAPTYKRGRAVARGRYHQIFKRNSHIVIGVTEPEMETKAKAKAQPKKKVAPKKAASKKEEVKKATTKKKTTKKTTETKSNSKKAKK